MDENAHIALPSIINNIQTTQAKAVEEDIILDRASIGLAHSEFGVPTPRSSVDEYAELKRLIRQKGLLNKQPVYYTFKLLLTLSMLIVGLTLLVVLNNFWLQLLNAVYLAFVFGQIGFIGHDAGHRQIFRATWKNDLVGLIVSFVVGISHDWWIYKHNQHHSHPNQIDLDPDVNVPLISYTLEQAQARHRLFYFVSKYQAYFFFPVLFLVGIGFRIHGVRFLLRKEKGKYFLIEILLMAMHFLTYGVLLSRLGVLQAILFIIIHQMLFGLYMGSVFAPNHKGMPVLDKESQLNFLYRQVLTSRNIKPSLFTDFWYGGLNYQIEHHLFPNMARNKLNGARQIVKSFCQAHSIDYHETGILRSYREILQHLHSVSAQLQGKDLNPNQSSGSPL